MWCSDSGKGSCRELQNISHLYTKLREKEEKEEANWWVLIKNFLWELFPICKIHTNTFKIISHVYLIYRLKICLWYKAHALLNICNFLDIVFSLYARPGEVYTDKNVIGLVQDTTKQYPPVRSKNTSKYTGFC